MPPSETQPVAYVPNRYIVYRERSRYRLVPDSNLYTGCDIVAAGSAKAMEAAVRLMESSAD